MYISPSNIIETGYTQGEKFTDAKGNFYKGYYFKDNTGRYWTGKSPSVDSKQLKDQFPPVVLNNNYLVKHSVISTDFTKIYKPLLETPLIKSEIAIPTDKDYNRGFFTRYIFQLKSALKPELNISEVTKDSYDFFTKITNVTKSYKIASIRWKLTGPVNDIYKNNIRIEPGVRDSNLRSIQDAEKVIINLSLYFKDPLQFSYAGVEKADNANTP
jgi:hypothetical protein